MPCNLLFKRFSRLGSTKEAVVRPRSQRTATGTAEINHAESMSARQVPQKSGGDSVQPSNPMEEILLHQHGNPQPGKSQNRREEKEIHPVPRNELEHDGLH
jgi:hypothetical protein